MMPRKDPANKENSTTMFGARVQDTEGVSLPVKVRDMAGRFLARAARRKSLSLRGMPPMVSFTFDDVPCSACETGAQILERHGVRGTFYVAGAGCGAASPVGTLASAAQIGKLWAKGHEIGCHTYSHPDVSRISLAELDRELDNNRSLLRTIEGKIAPRNFAYPYGQMSARSKRRLESRFDSCRSVHPGINNGVADLGSLKAWPLENAALDRAKIAALIAEAIATRGWLVFYSHDVAEQPSTYGVTPDLLDWTVSAAKQSGCVVATIAGCLELIGGENAQRSAVSA
jgi:peptidoglycan/xylan/chitin deacetylase (PgdA/CDA1 family)